MFMYIFLIENPIFLLCFDKLYNAPKDAFNKLNIYHNLPWQ